MISIDFDLATARQHFAEELRVVAGITNPSLTQAFASVERERFLGAPPWQIAPQKGLQGQQYRLTSEPRDLYHDLVVALNGEKSLNSAQPSIMAVMLEGLNLQPGHCVAQIGSGSGYYTAILAECVGPQGMVQAYEIESDIYQNAAKLLAPYPQIQSHLGDAAAADFAALDGLILCAGVTHLPVRWLAALHEGARAVVPFYIGASADSREALVIRIERKGREFAVAPLLPCGFYPCQSLCVAEEQAQLHAALHSRKLLEMRRLRIDPHAREATCIAHFGELCLSA